MSVAVEQEKICKAPAERNVNSPERAFDPSIGRSPMLDDQHIFRIKRSADANWLYPLRVQIISQNGILRTRWL